MTYICLQDIVLFDRILAKKDDIVELDGVLMSENININLDKNFLSNEKLFKKIEPLTIKTKEWDEDKDEILKDWVIEIKVNTTRNKLRLIEETIRKEIAKLIS